MNPKTDIVALQDKLTKSAPERERWKNTGRKLIKLIRRNSFDSAAINTDQLKQFGFEKDPILVLEDAMGEDFKDVMQEPLKNLSETQQNTPDSNVTSILKERAERDKQRRNGEYKGAA